MGKVTTSDKKCIRGICKIIINLLWAVMTGISGFKGNICMTIMFGIFLIDSSMMIWKEEIIENLNN